MKKCLLLGATVMLFAVACGGASNSNGSDDDDSGGAGGAGTAGSNAKAGSANTAGTSHSAGATSTAGGGGMSSGGASAAGAANGGTSTGGSSGGAGGSNSAGTGGASGGSGGSDLHGVPATPMGTVQSCFGTKCALQECDNDMFWADIACSEVYDAPVDASTMYCAADGTGSYCLQVRVPNGFAEDRYAVNCTNGKPTILKCNNGCGYSGDDPVMCSG